jgi:hypothetical protein
MTDRVWSGRMSRRRFLRTAVAGTVVAAPVFWKRPGWTAVTPRGVHLTYGADPATGMTISWSTPNAVDGPALRFGPSPSEYGDLVGAETRTVQATLPIYENARSHYHHVRLEGLAPSTSYSYRVEHGGGASEDLTFTTAPATPEPFTFTAFGDQGVGAGGVSTTSRVREIAPAFHFHVGDLCYAHSVIGFGLLGPTTQATWDQWLEQIRPVASTAPWMTAVGNHEMEPGYGDLGYGGYFSRFSLPSGDDVTYYSFRYGNVGFIALDANDASYEIPHNQCYTSFAQDRWLRDTLLSLRADSTIDFIVVGFHHCAYCTNAVHASDAGVRERWGALFDELNVDLVINGHNHCYERTHPVRGGVPTAEVGLDGLIRPVDDGTTYVTAGGGGSQPYPLSLYPISTVSIAGGLRVPETAEWSSIRANELSVLRVDVAPPAGPGAATTMRVRGLLPSGTVLDDFVLERNQGSRYTQARPAAEPLLPHLCIGSLPLL